MTRPRIAVLSGKGGTGKTTLAVSLALFVPGSQLLDCDVEEPDAAFYLRPEIVLSEELTGMVPALQPKRCDGCEGQDRPTCAAVCEFGALVVVKGKVLVFPERCAGCGACIDLCPRNALAEGEKVLGRLEEGRSGGVLVTTGRLRVGEPRATELVRAVKRWAQPDRVVVIDGPPGVGCSAAEALRGAEAAVLVAEPTPFGRHDLERALELAEAVGVPAGVVLNRADLGDRAVEDFLNAAGVPFLLRIPFDPEVARAGARGVPLVEVRKELGPLLAEIVDDLAGWAGAGAGAGAGPGPGTGAGTGTGTGTGTGGQR